MEAGFTEKEARKIEKNYHDMYKVSDASKQAKLKQASLDGYVTGAFGLRLRTPVLAQVVYGSSMPHKAAEESRTAGNMLGQSYGQLNLRTLFKFMEKVWNSEYRYQIRPCCSIHDANYFIIDNNIGCLKFVNDNLIEEMKWQDLPELKHDVVKLGGELDVFENWAKPKTLPNNASKQDILALCKEKK